MYIHQFQSFADLFTGMRCNDQDSIHAKNNRRRGSHKSRRRHVDKKADEKELIAFMLKSVDKWM
jgi:hypothetical protein